MTERRDAQPGARRAFVSRRARRARWRPRRARTVAARRARVPRARLRSDRDRQRIRPQDRRPPRERRRSAYCVDAYSEDWEHGLAQVIVSGEAYLIESGTGVRAGSQPAVREVPAVRRRARRSRRARPVIIEFRVDRSCTARRARSAASGVPGEEVQDQLHVRHLVAPSRSRGGRRRRCAPRPSPPCARTASTHGVTPSIGQRGSFSPAITSTGAVTCST